MKSTPEEKRARQPWKFHVVRSESGKRFWFAERHNIGGRPPPEVVHAHGDESGAALINAIAMSQE